MKNTPDINNRPSSSVRTDEGQPSPSPNTLLTQKEICAYAMGHVLNDMCAATWFSYLLIFLHEVVHLSPIEAGYVMLSGQIADGLATPVVGILSDQSRGCASLGLGRRQTWLTLGAGIVICTYYMVFGENFLQWFILKPTSSSLVIYYAVAASLFNIGWATVQVSHMALAPELSSCDTMRCNLNSSRYACTILSNVSVFLVFLLLLHNVMPVNVSTKYKFQWLANFILFVGIGTVLAFLYGTKEKPIVASSSHSNLETSSTTSWTVWFSQLDFYRIGVVYMCTRLVINLTQVFIPFFLTITLKMSAESIAIVPCLVYLSGFLTTFGMKTANRVLGRTLVFILGASLVISGLAMSYFLTPATANFVYASSWLVGMGNTLIMVTSVCIVGDLVGDQTNGAFVYGAMSFTDKLSNGLVIIVIQQGRETIEEVFGYTSVESGEYLRTCYCLVPTIAAFIGIGMVLMMQYGSGHLSVIQKRRVQQQQQQEDVPLVSVSTTGTTKVNQGGLYGTID